MNREIMHSEKCVRCGQCTQHCVFLKSHDINLMDYERDHARLHSGCMTCKRCQEVCHFNIDGSAITHKIRRHLHKSRTLKRKPYRLVLAEKRPYLFKNYRLVKGSSVFFPGCNFSAYFPKSTLQIAQKLETAFSAGLLFECCSKPIYEMGMQDEAIALIHQMEDRLMDQQVAEIITACPNCTDFLQRHLKQMRVTSIYAHLNQLGPLASVFPEQLSVFKPCPDRFDSTLLKQIQDLLPADTRIEPIDDIQCCGLGGLAACGNRALPQTLINTLKAKHPEHIYTYCATCYGNFKRNGIEQTSHLLLDLLGLSEPFPKGSKSLINRALFTFQNSLK